MNPVTVYVLEVGHYDSSTVVAVFTTQEAALAVPVVESEVFMLPADPADCEWQPPNGESGWYREADGGHVTAHTLDAVPTFGDTERAE